MPLGLPVSKQEGQTGRLAAYKQANSKNKQADKQAASEEGEEEGEGEEGE